MSGGAEAVLIAGPTASGKSALALALARATGGTIVNADSMQLYRDLRILTARPDPDEMAQAPHRLFGEVDGAENFSVGRYLAAAAPLLTGLLRAGELPILVGGTGLYFKALTEGLSDIPAVPDDVRAQVRAASEGRDATALHAELAGRDPQTAARLRASDRQRVLRALEILAATGRPLASFQGRRRPAILAGRRLLRLFLAPDRTVLRRRIDRRFVEMMGAGALSEVEELAGRRLDPALPIMRAHGVPALLAHLRGEVSLEAAVVRGQADTRAYAKRQITWFRHQMSGWTAVEPDVACEAAYRELAGRVL